MSAAERDTGGPAFPEAGLSGLPNGDVIYSQPGMTLRDYFAAKAMQGFVAGIYEGWEFEPAEPISIAVATDMALSSYRIADAMLKAKARA